MKLPVPDLVIAGKYCLEGQLATGGMGSVWVARHLDLDVPVAIKFMGPECASSEEGRIRFEREAKAAAFLQSPHVVNVQDYGVDDDLAYIVMELLVGEDLEDRLHRQGRLSLRETLNILTQAAKALRRAQDLGIVHRDIKPQNFFLATGDDGDEHLKVLDFGIAKETGPVLLAKGTNTGQIIGSPHYMSPEHVRGTRDIDHRADLWSLGVIVFQCVTGQLPFPGEIVGDVMGKILADPIPKPTDIAPDLPPEMDDFFKKALARDRNERFQSAREMAEAFAEIVRGEVPSSQKISLSTPPPPVASERKGGEAVDRGAPTLGATPNSLKAPPPTEAPAASAPAAARGRRGAYLAAFGALAVLGILLVVMRGSSGGGPTGGTPGAGEPGKEQAVIQSAQPTTVASAPAPATATAEATSAPSASASADASARPSAAPAVQKGARPAAPKPSATSKVKPPNWGF